uniref:Transposable element P transposase n=1 Tax=Melanaphis sacchari TaxID=742174 RepID=A0A2H8TT66_9HEMI
MSRGCGSKCVYMDCNKSARKNTGLKFRKFPKNDKIRKMWILNTGNVNLVHLTSDELSRRYICDDHFLDVDYTNDKKTRLTKNAVPKKYEDIEHLHVTTPYKVYKKMDVLSPTAIETISKNGSPSLYIQTPSRIQSDSDNLFITSTSSTPVLTPKTRTFIEESHIPTILKPKTLFSNNNDSKISKLKIALQLKKKQIRNKNASLLKLKKNLKILRESKKNKSTLLDSLYYPSADSKTLVKMQVLRPKFSRKKFTKNEQNFALSLFYKSPSAYKFLKNNKQLTLPGLSTIRRWIGSSKFKPGFNVGIFKQLKKKSESMSEDELYCTMIFDEMKIKNYLEYSKFLDVVEGFEDLGPKGRTNKLAGQAMVFMIRGLYSSWKMPICYFLPATSVKNNILSELIVETVQRLLNCGFFIKAVICDQGANNVSALRLIKVTKDKPFFEVDGRKIYSIFDTPHLFKNFRNHFIKSNFKFQNEEVSFQDVRNVYNIDKNSTSSRSLLKITENHINPGPFQMMSCKLAMQLFSNTMAATIKTCVYRGAKIQNCSSNSKHD